MVLVAEIIMSTNKCLYTFCRDKPIEIIWYYQTFIYWILIIGSIALKCVLKFVTY